MPWPKTDAIHNHGQLGLLDKVRAIKGLVGSRAFGPAKRNSPSFFYYQPAPEV